MKREQYDLLEGIIRGKVKMGKKKAKKPSDVRFSRFFDTIKFSKVPKGEKVSFEEGALGGMILFQVFLGFVVEKVPNLPQKLFLGLLLLGLFASYVGYAWFGGLLIFVIVLKKTSLISLVLLNRLVKTYEGKIKKEEVV